MNENLITLYDEDGNEVPFEFLDYIEYDHCKYVALLPLEGDLDNAEVHHIRKKPLECFQRFLLCHTKFWKSGSRFVGAAGDFVTEVEEVLVDFVFAEVVVDLMTAVVKLERHVFEMVDTA